MGKGVGVKCQLLVMIDRCVLRCLCSTTVILQDGWVVDGAAITVVVSRGVLYISHRGNFGIGVLYCGWCDGF